jgi:RNA polymerase sigma-70 factor (ECF subfamily)
LELSELTFGDPEAWDRFVQRHLRVVYSAVLRVMKNKAYHYSEWDVDDAVQDVFIRLMKDDFHQLKTFNPEKASLVTWLSLVARNTTIDLLRKRKARTVSTDEISEVVSAPTTPAPISDQIPPDLLSPRQMLILHLLLEKGLSPEEVGEVLDVDAQTIRSTKHKAILKLREYYQELEAEEDG